MRMSLACVSCTLLRVLARPWVTGGAALQNREDPPAWQPHVPPFATAGGCVRSPTHAGRTTPLGANHPVAPQHHPRSRSPASSRESGSMLHAWYEMLKSLQHPARSRVCIPATRPSIATSSTALASLGCGGPGHRSSTVPLRSHPRPPSPRDVAEKGRVHGFAGASATGDHGECGAGHRRGSNHASCCHCSTQADDWGFQGLKLTLR